MEDGTRMKKALDASRAQEAERSVVNALEQGSQKELKPMEDGMRMKHEARDSSRAQEAER